MSVVYNLFSVKVYTWRSMTDSCKHVRTSGPRGLNVQFSILLLFIMCTFCVWTICHILISGYYTFFPHNLTVSVLQLMQQQAAIMAASHGGYLAPSMAFPATQIHQVGAINMNGLPPTTMTPVSGQSKSLLHNYTSYL